MLATGCCALLACSSNDNSGGDGAGGMGPGSGGSVSSAGAGAKGGGAGTGGTTGGTGGSGGTGGATMAGTGASGGSGGIGNGGSGTAGANNGGAPATGGSGGKAAAGAPGGGAPGAGSGGANGGSAGASGGSAGAAGGGSAGAPTGGMAGSAGGSSTANYTCTEVIGIDSTNEWYTAGFETYVPDGKWQLLYHHPGYVEDWGVASDDVWKTPTSTVTTNAPTLLSPCTTNSNNPDRVIYNIFVDGGDSSITNKAAYATGLANVVTQIKAHYSNVKRIDLLTMTRAPMNVACSSSNAAGSMIPQYEDDAVQMEVSSGTPAVVASPPFFVMACSDFDSTGGPHFSDAGKTNAAKLYGMYYASEP